MACSHYTCPHYRIMERAKANLDNADLLAQAQELCIKCKHQKDPSNPSGTVSYEAASDRVLNAELDSSIIYARSHSRGYITTLPHEVEEKILEMMRGLMQLDPLEVLMLHHIANGGTGITFAEYLNCLSFYAGLLKTETTSFRATFWDRWQKITSRLPFLSALQNWQGTSIRKHRNFNPASVWRGTTLHRILKGLREGKIYISYQKDASPATNSNTSKEQNENNPPPDESSKPSNTTNT